MIDIVIVVAGIVFFAIGGAWLIAFSMGDARLSQDKRCDD